MKAYITFGQAHRHEIYGTLLDRNCVAVIEVESYAKAREKAFELFGQKWCWLHTREEDVHIEHYPGGFVEVLRRQE